MSAGCQAPNRECPFGVNARTGTARYTVVKISVRGIEIGSTREARQAGSAHATSAIQHQHERHAAERDHVVALGLIEKRRNQARREVRNHDTRRQAD